MKLISVIILYIGIFDALIGILFTCVIFLIYALIKRIPKGEKVAFAPFLSIGTILSIVFGGNIEVFIQGL